MATAGPSGPAKGPVEAGYTPLKLGTQVWRDRLKVGALISGGRRGGRAVRSVLSRAMVRCRGVVERPRSVTQGEGGRASWGETPYPLSAR